MNGPTVRVGIFLLVASMATLSGCSAPGDTSGYKPEPAQSTSQINDQIAQIKANNQMPPGIKDVAIKKLQAQLTSAK